MSDLAYVGPRVYAAFRAELAANSVAQSPGFQALDWRKRKRLANKARRRARADLRNLRSPSIADALLAQPAPSPTAPTIP